MRGRHVAVTFSGRFTIETPDRDRREKEIREGLDFFNIVWDRRFEAAPLFGSHLPDCPLFHSTFSDITLDRGHAKCECLYVQFCCWA